MITASVFATVINNVQVYPAYTMAQSFRFIPMFSYTSIMINYQSPSRSIKLADSSFCIQCYVNYDLYISQGQISLVTSAFKDSKKFQHLM